MGFSVYMWKVRNFLVKYLALYFQCIIIGAMMMHWKYNAKYMTKKFLIFQVDTEIPIVE